MKKSFPFSKCSTRMSSRLSLQEVRAGAESSSTYTLTVISTSSTVRGIQCVRGEGVRGSV